MQLDSFFNKTPTLTRASFLAKGEERFITLFILLFEKIRNLVLKKL
jgi:hypothetical protein